MSRLGKFMICKEELMRNTDSVIWGFSGGTATPELDDTHKLCEKIWTALNSRVCNVVIVIFVFAEGVVVLSELLIDLNVVQDPEWKAKSINCSQNSTGLPSENISPRIKKAKEAFSITSITLLTIFIIEVILRIVTGKTRFIVQGIEVFDAIIVLVAFGLDIAFFVAPSKVGIGKEAAVLIILLRLWRITAIIKSIITSSKEKLSNALGIYQKEKIQSDHKVDLLILKVEDLEHEVAYLKEKLKKTEKEPLFMKRRKAKESSSLPFPLPSSISIPMETIRLPTSQSLHENCHSPFQVRELKNKVTLFAENAATIIVDEALLLASHIRSPSDLPPPMATSPTRNKGACKLRRRPDGSIESGYGSASSSMNWSKSRPHTRSEEEKQSAPLAAIRDTLKCPESSPESGYGSGGSAHNPNVDGVSPGISDESGKPLANKTTKLVGTVFLFPESPAEISTSLNEVNMKILDEKSEIERIRHVEFNPNKLEKDVPMTSL
ncbi:uncharacterized protein LOC129975748 isoform X1 [Argiope bruennichi]|uniref:uncharacterized protein LOC129975748 isoform X1 n=2 Tax=Argiope bruennichi TaxID=94029 RepID=UPI002493D2EE|nr:uncharacterized protein LOC129975748 isoform X1 [Argiope bruennichi]